MAEDDLYLFAKPSELTEPWETHTPHGFGGLSESYVTGPLQDDTYYEVSESQDSDKAPTEETGGVGT